MKNAVRVRVSDKALAELDRESGISRKMLMNHFLLCGWDCNHLIVSLPIALVLSGEKILSKRARKTVAWPSKSKRKLSAIHPGRWGSSNK